MDEENESSEKSGYTEWALDLIFLEKNITALSILHFF